MLLMQIYLCILQQLHSRYLSILESFSHVGYEVLTAAVTNIAIFWDIEQCIPQVNRRLGRMFRFRVQGRKSAEKETSV
jgi:hypothetical protein